MATKKPTREQAARTEVEFWADAMPAARAMGFVHLRRDGRPGVLLSPRQVRARFIRALNSYRNVLARG